MSLFFASACTAAPKDATPAGALRAFLEAAERAPYEPHARAELFSLLDERSRSQLTHRAREASALSAGQDFEPWEMLPRESLRVHIAPAEAIYRERVNGQSAVVAVQIPQSEGRHEVQMVREGDAWRVVLDIPSAPPRAFIAPPSSPATPQ